MEVKRLFLDEVDIWKVELCELIKETMRFNFPTSIFEEDYYLETIERLRKYLECDEAVVFIAIQNETLLGWVWCHEIQRLEEKRIHIANLAVNSNKRNEGIGSGLLSKVEEYARKNNYSSIELLVTSTNISAIKFYEKNIFKVERLVMKKDVKK